MNVQLSIGGHEVAGQDTFDRKDPVTGQIASTSAAATVADAQAAAKAAQAAFNGWATMGPTARRALLNKAADVLEAKTPDFIETMTAETGATGPWGGFNCHLAAGHLREAAAMTTSVTGETIPGDKPGMLAMSVRKPKGVCLGIAPWNAPVILGVRAIAAPLACGNTVILKGSEACPKTHRLIVQCFEEAGLPEGVVNYISNAPADAAEVVKALIEAPEVKHVNFTGSTNVGRIIGGLAGAALKPALLELGGKAPLIVLDDADLDGAVNAAIFGAYANNGQICMSTERVIVQDGIADAFVEKMAARAAALPHGNPREHVVLGALVEPEVGEKMDAIIADATSKGAKVVAGGTRDGAIHSATLVDHVTSEMRIYSQESFGPVKPVIRVKDEAEAIAIANDTEYGLSAAVFSQDIKRAMRIADEIQSGIVHINGPTVADEPHMPFGGIGASGYGRFGGAASIAEFTDLRWMTIEDPDQHYPF